MSTKSTFSDPNEEFEKWLDTAGSPLPPRPSSPAEPAPDGATNYPITKEELQILARHWYRGYLDREIEWFFHYCVSGSDRRFRRYASYRLDLIEEALGADVVEQAVEEVRAEQRRTLGHEVWRVF